MKLSVLYEDTIDENWRDVAKKAALGAALAFGGHAMGATQATQPASAPTTQTRPASSDIEINDLIKEFIRTKDKDTGQTVLTAITNSAAAKAKDHDFTGAIYLLNTQAARVCELLQDKKKTEEINDTIKGYVATRATYNKVKDLTDKVGKDPAAANTLFKIYMYELDEPDNALNLAKKLNNEQMMQTASLAAKDVNKLSEAELVSLADEYSKNNLTDKSKSLYIKAATSLDITNPEYGKIVSKINEITSKFGVFATGNIISGKWQSKNNTITINDSNLDNKLAIGVATPKYSIQLKCQAKEQPVVNGHEAAFGIILPVGKKQVCVEILGGKSIWLDRVDGQTYGNASIDLTKQPGVVDIDVASDGNNSTINVSINKKIVIHWSGRTDSLSLLRWHASPKLIYLGAHNSGVMFDGIVVKNDITK